MNSCLLEEGNKGLLQEKEMSRKQLEAEGWTQSCTFGNVSLIFKKERKRLVWDQKRETVWLEYDI